MMSHWCSTAVHMKSEITVLLITAALLCTGILMTHNRTIHFMQGEKPSSNPLKGYVCWGENNTDDPRIGFAYVPIYWKECEVQEGIYDFTLTEERFHVQEWKGRNVSLILRVIMDEPTDVRHMDIPEWLYEKTGGLFYDNDYGKGFSPDYTSTVLQQAHHKLIQALYERYGSDPYVAYIQLGSLGHWGEWHTSTSVPFPPSDITDRYVQDYLDFFPAEKLLLRRPYDIGKINHLGLYNDSFGNSTHDTWLDWIENGYVSDQNGESLSDMCHFWKYNVSGGEFATDHELEWYFTDEQYSTTLDYIRKSHTTFLGPNSPIYVDHPNVDDLVQQMGYCYTITSLSIHKQLIKNSCTLTFRMDNIGTAPLYAKTDVTVQLKDQNNIIQSQTKAIDFRQYGTDAFTITFSFENLPEGTYDICFGISDPRTGKPGIAIANDLSESNMIYNIGA